MRDGGPRPGELRIESELTDDRLRLSLHGELDLATGGVLEEQLRQHGAGGRHVVLDMAGVDFMDSTGVRILLDAKRQADSAGLDFQVLALTAPVRRLLEITGVLSRLEANRDH